MPVPNELSPEDEALFAEHGVLPLGPGGEPIAEEGQQPPVTPPVETPSEPIPSPDDRPRDAQGRFVAPTAPSESEPPAEQTPGGDPTQAPPPGFVPHAALHQARMEKQQLAAQFAALQARTNALLARSQPQQLELPDLETDPVGYVRTLGENLRDMHAQAAQEHQRTQLEQAFEQDEELFTSYTPDYPQAAEHYAVSRMTELSQFYPREQVQAMMMEEAREVARMAWQKGVPAAQMVYQLAQARGYRPGAAPAVPSPAPTPAANGNGATAPNAAAVVAAAKANQAGSRSLSNAGGTNAATALNAEALLSMSDEEFEAYLKLGEKGANARFAAIGG